MHKNDLPGNSVLLVVGDPSRTSSRNTNKGEGTLPAIIDFYADWCGPCKMVAPILEELSKEYEGKIVIYKVDTEAEQELSAVFSIRSIPTFLFIPVNGQPAMQPGALPKHVFKQVIDEHLVGEKQFAE